VLFEALRLCFISAVNTEVNTNMLHVIRGEGSTVLPLGKHLPIVAHGEAGAPCQRLSCLMRLLPVAVGVEPQMIDNVAVARCLRYLRDSWVG